MLTASRHRLALFVAALAYVVLGAVIVAPTPAAAQYDATSGPLEVLYKEGCYLWVAGGGFAPGSLVDITLSSGSTNIRDTTADAAGFISYLIIFNNNDNPGKQVVTAATGVNPGGGIHTLTVRLVVPGYCANTNWWEGQGPANPPPPNLPDGTDGDPTPPLGPLLFLSEGPSSDAFPSDATDAVELGGFAPNADLTEENIARVMASLPASPSGVPTPSTASVLPLAALLAILGVVSWRISRKIDLV